MKRPSFHIAYINADIDRMPGVRLILDAVFKYPDIVCGQHFAFEVDFGWLRLRLRYLWHHTA